MTAEIHLLAGLNGAGKSTYARHLEATVPAVRFSLDEWMLRLHQLPYDHPRYPELADRCRELIWDTAAQVLGCGTSVVLDWNCWSRDLRRTAVRRAHTLGAACHLHHVRSSVELATTRAVRREDQHSHRLDAPAVAHLAGLFETPGPDEGFTLHTVTR